VFPRGATILTIELSKIRTRQPAGYATESKILWIRFLIDPVANGTKTHIPKPSFNTLPYSRGGFIQTIGGGGCGVCGAAYLTLAVVLLRALTGASSGTKLAVPGMADVGEIVEMGMGAGV
jgi:hypothetical protein